MKKQRKVEKDNRGVAIYARKSRITNKGDSIGVQFKQCADYAKKELGLDEDYEFCNMKIKDSADIFQTDRIFRECCMMCRTEKSKQSYVTSWIVSAEKQQT